jgi:hypothetical protein
MGALHPGTESHRGAHALRVVHDPRRDLVATHEPVGIGPVVVPSRKRRRPVRGDQRQLVPAILPASADTVPTFDDEVLAALVGQEAGHRQAGVPGAHDQDVDGLRSVPPSGRRSFRRTAFPNSRSFRRITSPVGPG